MSAPEPLFDRPSVLIADTQSFCATYVAQAFAMFGWRVFGPFESPEEIHELLIRGEIPSAAIVSLDWQDRTHNRIVAQLETMRVPYVLVDNTPWNHVLTGATFSWPYNAFQIFEATRNMTAQAVEAARH